MKTIIRIAVLSVMFVGGTIAAAMAPQAMQESQPASKFTVQNDPRPAYPDFKHPIFNKKTPLVLMVPLNAFTTEKVAETYWTNETS